MKNFYSSFLVSLFIFSPVAVFACGGGESNNWILPAVFLYIAIVGIFYIINFKKFLDKKWNFLQYMIIILVAAPISLPVFFFAIDSISHFDLFSLLIIVPSSFLVGISIILFPTFIRKRWVYTWGFVMYYLFTIVATWVVIQTLNNTLCGNNPNF